jgi:hypothetical protein
MSDYEGILAVLGIDAVLFFFLAVCILVGGFITAGLYIVVIKLAEERKRDVAIWVLLSFVSSPLLMIIVLLVVGEEKKIE